MSVLVVKTKNNVGERLTFKTTGRINSPMTKTKRQAPSVEARVEETKTKLLEAGVALFSQRGYSGVGLKELLQTVNVPKGSFYNYFDSKEDFARHTIAYYGSLFEHLLNQVINEPDSTAVQRFENLFTALIRVLEKKNFTEGCLIGDLSTELGDVSESCRNSLDKVLDLFAASFETLVRQGQADGSVRVDIDATDLAAFSLDAWEGSLIRMRLKKDKMPLEQSKRLILQYLQG